MQIKNPDAANFVWQTNFCYGGREYPKFRQKIAQKTGIFGPETPFSYISALFGLFYSLFGPFLTLFNTQTLFLAMLGEIC